MIIQTKKIHDYSDQKSEGLAQKRQMKRYKLKAK